MFDPLKETKIVFDKLNDIYYRAVNCEDVTNDESWWLNNEFQYDFAKCLRAEVPDMLKIAKLICVMDDSLNIKVEDE